MLEDRGNVNHGMKIFKVATLEVAGGQMGLSCDGSGLNEGEELSNTRRA